MDAVGPADCADEHAVYAVRLLKSGRHVMSEALPCETMAQAKVLNFRNREERERYRYDTACANPKIAGKRPFPVYHDGVVRMDDAEYARIRGLREEGKNNGD